MGHAAWNKSYDDDDRQEGSLKELKLAPIAVFIYYAGVNHFS